MNLEEFKSLKARDVVIIRTGFDYGKRAIVRYWYNETVLVEAFPGEHFGTKSRTHNSDLMLVDFKLLELVKEE